MRKIDSISLVSAEETLQWLTVSTRGRCGTNRPVLQC